MPASTHGPSTWIRLFFRLISKYKKNKNNNWFSVLTTNLLLISTRNIYIKYLGLNIHNCQSKLAENNVDSFARNGGFHRYSLIKYLKLSLDVESIKINFWPRVLFIFQLLSINSKKKNNNFNSGADYSQSAYGWERYPGFMQHTPIANRRRTSFLFYYMAAQHGRSLSGW